MKQKKMFLMMAVLLLAFMFAGCAGDTVEDDTADNPEQEASVEEQTEQADETEQSEEETAADPESDAQAESTGITLDVTLVDESGAVLSGYQLSLSQSGAVYLEAQSDENGLLALSDLPLGSTFDLALTDAEGNEVAQAAVSLLPGDAVAAAVSSDGTIELTAPDDLAEGAFTATLQITADGVISCTDFNQAVDDTASGSDAAEETASV